MGIIWQKHIFLVSELDDFWSMIRASKCFESFSIWKNNSEYKEWDKYKLSDYKHFSNLISYLIFVTNFYFTKIEFLTDN